LTVILNTGFPITRRNAGWKPSLCDGCSREDVKVNAPNGDQYTPHAGFNLKYPFRKVTMKIPLSTRILIKSMPSMICVPYGL
jgi:hypothetical protein